MDQLEAQGRVIAISHGKASAVRLLTKSDGVGFSVSEARAQAGESSDLWYKNHWEANYVRSGRGLLEDRTTGEQWPLAPGVLFFLFYVIFPIFQSFNISLYKWDGLGEARYIGFQNYYRLFNDRAFEISLWNNLKWLILYLLAIPAGLFIAIFLNQTVTGIRLYKSLFFFPFVISQVVVGLVFTFAYIVYFKFIAPDANHAGHWWFGISPEGIGVVGAALNFATALTVSRFTPKVPDTVQSLVESIRIPAGVERPHEH